jgi:hypothetical protein
MAIINVKKTAAAIFQYQTECDGEFDENQLYFENRTAEIIQFTLMLSDECEVSENVDQCISDC